MKNQFLLNREITFLNHGSFGACPKQVFSSYQTWQRNLESEPVAFLSRYVLGYLADAREKLGRFLGCQADNLVFFTNPTTAINMVVRNLPLKAGDEILTTNHEYGAMDRTWSFISKKMRTNYVQKPVPLPVTTHQEFIDSFWDGVNERTRVVFLSHITSPTALIFPVKEICQRARESGILSIIDGAHAPGQIDVNLEEIGADIYTGACHKWMMSPKGASFLYARKEVQDWLEPLIVSWGYDADSAYGSGKRFVDYHEWQGTRDPSAFLAVPEAINFMEQNDWRTVRKNCRDLAKTARRKIVSLTGLNPICPEAGEWLGQMVSVRLPQINPRNLQASLYDKYKIEIPVYSWHESALLRVSIQAYNNPEDINKLVAALRELLMG